LPLRCLPYQEVSLGAGHIGIIIRFESVTERAGIEVLTAREDFRVLSTSSV
jgi:hypothetical protein